MRRIYSPRGRFPIKKSPFVLDITDLKRIESLALNTETEAPFRARVESFNVPFTSPVLLDWANSTAGDAKTTIKMNRKISLISG
jgi:hypothetical protein